MVEAKGPVFPRTVRSSADLTGLRVADAETDLGYVLEAIKLTKKELNNRVPLIGFAGAPFTIFCYMTEGKGSKTFSVAKKLLYTDPLFAHTLLRQITDSTINYPESPNPGWCRPGPTVRFVGGHSLAGAIPDVLAAVHSANLRCCCQRRGVERAHNRLRQRCVFCPARHWPISLQRSGIRLEHGPR